MYRSNDGGGMRGGGYRGYDNRTGDPSRDFSEASADYRSGSANAIPDEVVEFLKLLRRSLRDQNVPEIGNLYQYGFDELTEKYFKDRFWPNDEQVAALFPEATLEDETFRLFLILYKELYYRYVYAKIQRGPSLDYRVKSFNNYSELFSAIIQADPDPLPLMLPTKWEWDIVDEFVYQFQSFCQFKANPSKRTADDREELAEVERSVWNLYPLLNILYQLVKKGQVIEQLTAVNKGEGPPQDIDEFGSHPVYFGLGYFSLIGLLRVHTLLGEFSLALKLTEQIDLGPQGLHSAVPSCLVTLHYYMGFCHMMLRHYQEAIRLFVNCLLYINRTRNLNQQKSSWQYDVVSKTNEQIYQLLAICLTLCPQRIDESIQSQLTEKLSERMNRLARGEQSEFEGAFNMGCPKFLAPTISSFEMEGNFAKEPTLQQTRLFMAEMRQQQLIPILRGYLKLYSSIEIKKLASFMELQPEDLVCFLLSFKHKLCDVSRDVKDTDDDTSADLDFYIDKDMIHIADTKVGRRYGEYFIRHIQKLIELNKNLDKLNGKLDEKRKLAQKALVQ